MNLKNIYKFIFLVAFTIVNFAFVANGKVITQTKQQSMTPQQVFMRLKEGNQRFVSGKMKNRDLLAQANKSASSQFAVAVVLNCMDSRTPPEIVFDQGVAQIFVNRVAGNILNDDILGGMEFGTQLMGARLIAVIGHTSCGAMHGACEGAQLGLLTGLLNKIQPAVEEVSKQTGEKDCSKSTFIDEIAKANVLIVMKQIQEQSSVLSNLISEGKLGIVGGMQDLSTGKVTFFEDASIMPKEIIKP